MFSTKRLYEEDSTLLTCSAQVLDVLDENGTGVLILDQTIFLPPSASSQDSGDEASDIGLIESENKRFHVSRVERVEDYIRHVGSFEGEPFDVDEMVTCIARKEFEKELGGD